ncbi:hypothetical protein [Methylobacterium nodulans]|uniref:Uncharacterized protein n=1 Tax=Methylobacterium nodulans (strain LMG 21967 / CNCM I-2342 / ORS 2060) TaxID=460265 RepID=B8IUL8_METNO|nr:hypothetical protein [Methylobacterium nodulans]ACL57086.1 conserved hypothetical protein [Methylobacterium nodulans ORS 2060]
MELLLTAGAVMMIGGALPLFHGYKFLNPRGSETNRLRRRGHPIAWDTPTG